MSTHVDQPCATYTAGLAPADVKDEQIRGLLTPCATCKVTRTNHHAAHVDRGAQPSHGTEAQRAHAHTDVATEIATVGGRVVGVIIK